jgi:soluble lytic murein transglycosylase-like protein
MRRVATLLQGTRQSVSRSTTVFLRDVGHGLLEVSHNTLAIVGLLIVATVVFMGSRADLRQGLESRMLSWLQERHEARTEGTLEALEALAEPEAISRATAYNLKDLTKEQANVAVWLSRRYRVAPEPISRLVKEAWHVGGKANLDPTLILAVMAIESRFNPFAQSPVGAQGLMQVMTRVHDDKYEAFGGTHAAFDPVTNLRVGVQVLKECISRAGSLEAGLKYYVGAANLADDGGYAGKVFAEREHLRLVAAGRAVPIAAPLIVAPTTVSLPADEAPVKAQPIPVGPLPAPAEKATPDQVALAS